MILNSVEADFRAGRTAKNTSNYEKIKMLTYLEDETIPNMCTSNNRLSKYMIKT